ncbi:S-adenosylmethionine--2-demethylmenaquinone methyltransferase [Advenella sp. S44]|uniref:ribonuclease E activity regulator RraA n=1 Tax=Advenella sp. S44 TaxID=1982755 RepID=UPI000C2A6C75|nr:ribonuclease E activity regulator RraA [Advenella sp. S44]PJX22420.1 S-adenosylmethionine--2-demethylmenaquinone methyltransferase [Advenella sp. S44]
MSVSPLAALITCDIMDQYPSLPSCDTQFRSFGRRRAMAGKIRTVKVFEDNTFIRQVLSEPGKGDVLVVDAAASLHCAVVGDMIAKLALDNGWSGVIVYGAIRDSEQIDAMDFCVKALGTNPRKSGKNSLGLIDVPVTFGNMTFVPGQYLYSDADGIVVSAEPVSL